MQKTPETYDLRNEKVKELEFSDREKNDAKVGEFRWYYEGVNIGNEISKDEYFKRPCLILQNNLGNGLLLVAPITTKFYSRMDKYSIDIQKPYIYGLKHSRLLLNQIKLVDTKRLIGKLSENRVNSGFVRLVAHTYFDLIIKKSPIIKTG